MEQRLKESLSALLDGEADELELHRVLALSDDAELRALWARYHRVRTVMGEPDAHLHHFDISASVAAALAPSDSTAITPVAQPGAMVAVPVATSRFTRARIWKLGGVAASVAVAFVVGFTVQKPGLEIQSSALNQVAAVAPAAAVSTSPVVTWPAAQKAEPAPARKPVQYASQLNLQPGLIDRFSDADARRFNGYLLRHAEQSALSGRQGMAPFARVASFNAAGMSGSDFER